MLVLIVNLYRAAKSLHVCPEMYEVIYTRLKNKGCIRSPEYLSFGISYESMVVLTLDQPIF